MMPDFGSGHGGPFAAYINHDFRDWENKYLNCLVKSSATADKIVHEI